MCFEFAGEVAEFPFDQGGNKRREFKYPDTAQQKLYRLSFSLMKVFINSH